MGKARYHGEHALLLAKFQVCLKAHQVVQCARGIFGAQLHVGPGAVAGGRIDKAHRPQRAIAHGVCPAAGHHLNGHAALVHARLAVKFVQLGALGRHQRLVKRLVARLVKRAVQIICRAAAIARGGKHLCHIQALRRDDGRRGIVEGKLFMPCDGCNGRGKRALGKRAACHQRDALPRRGQGRNLFPAHGDARLRLHHPGDACAERIPVHGQRAARRHAARARGRQKRRAQKLHLGFQKAAGGIQPFGLEGVRAHKLGKARRMVRRAESEGLLLVQSDGPAPLCKVQRRLAARKARADDVDAHITPFSLPRCANSRSPLFRTPEGRCARPF